MSAAINPEPIDGTELVEDMINCGLSRLDVDRLLCFIAQVRRPWHGCALEAFEAHLPTWCDNKTDWSAEAHSNAFWCGDEWGAEHLNADGSPNLNKHLEDAEQNGEVVFFYLMDPITAGGPWGVPLYEASEGPVKVVRSIAFSPCADVPPARWQEIKKRQNQYFEALENDPASLGYLFPAIMADQNNNKK